MRILLGTLLGYSLRQKERLLITILTIVLITIYIVLPTLSLAIQAIALTHLGLSVHRRQLLAISRKQILEPKLGLNFVVGDMVGVETKIHDIRKRLSTP